MPNIWFRTPAPAAALILLSFSPAGADPVADFYKDKTLTIIAPNAPGNTASQLAQAFADHVGAYIPGNPKTRVEFMPGGGGLRAHNHFYVTSPRDGTALLLPNSSVAVSQLLEPKGVEYDTKKFNWLGVITPGRHVLMVRQDTGVKSLADLKNKEVFIGTTGAGSETDMYPRLANALLGTKMNIVPGFPGGQADVMLAVESGEMQGAVSGWQNWSARPDLTAKMNPIMAFGAGRQPQVPETPNILEVVTDPQAQQIIRLVSSVGPIGRGVITTPDVPADRVAALRAAFDKVIKNPTFVEKVKALKLQIEPTSGAEAQKLVEQALDVSPELVERAKSILAVAAQ
jgi:tripartite-type tricarboxylate transporter receptor subunit TctC